MRNQSRMWVLGIVGLLLAAVVTYGSDQKKSVILIFADGRQQTFALTDISRIEFKDAAIIIFKDGRQKTFSLSEVARIEFEPAGSNEPQFQFASDYDEHGTHRAGVAHNAVILGISGFCAELSFQLQLVSKSVSP